MALIDVIVLQCGLPELTVRFLESVAGADELHVILVDNGSPDEDVQAAEQALDRCCPNHTIWRNASNLGFAKAVNQGLRLARARYVCVQNNDTVMQHMHDHARLAAWLDAKPELGCVGPLANRAETEQSLPHALNGTAHLSYTDGLVAFFCAMLPREVVEEVGPLSEEFGLGYGEDDDYCIRLRQAGYRLGIARDVFVHHDHHATYLHTIGQDGIDREGAQGHAKLRELHGV